jgi:hypothetical protein
VFGAANVAVLRAIKALGTVKLLFSFGKGEFLAAILANESEMRHGCVDCIY